MLDKLTYINHLNQSQSFGSDGVFLTDLDLYDYEWSYNSNFDEITSFRKGITKRKMKIIILAQTEEEGIEKRNKIFEIFEQDVLEESQGKLRKGDYYLNCYVVASSKSKWFSSERYMENTITIISDRSDWVSEKKFEFLKSSESEKVEMDDLKKYPYKYGYYYKNQISSGTILNTSVNTSDFVMRIYGAVTNPLVMIGKHTYQVNVSINQGEYVEIDSENKTIYLIHANGRKESIYWSASKDSYIFQPIEKGTQTISWNGSFAFDLILKNKRSEPLWTLNTRT